MTWSGASSGEHFVASNPPSGPTLTIGTLTGAPVGTGYGYLQNGLDGRTAWKGYASLRNWPERAGLPVLMASPPAITLGAANAATSVAGSAFRTLVTGSPPSAALVPNLVTVSGGPTVVAQDFSQSIYPGWTEEVAQYTRYAILTDSPKFEWLIIGSGYGYRVVINGQLVTAQSQGPMLNDGNVYRLLIDFAGVRSLRDIVLEFDGRGNRARIQGLQMLATDTLVAAPRRGARVICVGDSFSEGTNSTDTTTAYIQTLSWLTGWDIWALAEGGTGYLQPNGGLGRTKAGGHLTDVTANAPDLVIWALGANDYANFTAAAIQTEATADFAVVQAALPGVPQLVLGPFAGTGNKYLDATWKGARDAIKAAALASGLPFADPIGTGYLTGTGSVSVPIGDGCADFLVSADTTHPTQAGHDALARACAKTIAEALRG